MADESSSSSLEGAQVRKITVQNNYGENLVGLLHETGSTQLVILCHGLGASKEDTTMVNLADAITKGGISVFRFDFAGNGESEGSFQFGNYLREVDDLRSVVLYFSGGKHAIITVLGHSKGEVWYRITEESMMERLGTDMHAACLSIDNSSRVLSVHGSSDEAIPVEDAFEFSKIIPNHKLHVIEGADHGYSKHQSELAEVVLNFIKASL
ncbi:hypothetical protein AQUCO_02500135v1 [Aquilegia coerulea]|uniref:Serine aminopeptidase S33 domain-containing protein n=1 Tax=Aquilegia coerulea TaxID=218851 RepID=A0A2G5D9Q6_AQUCA|nr:hypothetical protein AQUCO_02500135v1 [Aquilegia coerulea]